MLLFIGDGGTIIGAAIFFLRLINAGVALTHKILIKMLLKTVYHKIGNAAYFFVRKSHFENFRNISDSSCIKY